MAIRRSSRERKCDSGNEVTEEHLGKKTVMSAPPYMLEWRTCCGTYPIGHLTTTYYTNINSVSTRPNGKRHFVQRLIIRGLTNSIFSLHRYIS